MGFFADYRRKQRGAKARYQTWHYRHAGGFAEAAETFELMASEVRADNELIYSGELGTYK